MMTNTWRAAGLLIALALGGARLALAADDAASAPHNPMADLPWQKGPATFALGSHASIRLPEHTGALPEADSGKFLTMTGNLPSPGSSIIVGSDWWAVFDFDESGYIKDDEKIDADALLKTLKDSDGPANEERRKANLGQIYTDGWYIPPHYDPATRHLEWALKLHASDNPAPVINYTVRLLGRKGYERVVLVSSPERLDKDVAEFKQMLTAFDFNEGERYSEFRSGDRVAEFGLAALVAGGAAAVAVKTGFWKVLVGALVAGWKLVAAAVFAGLAALRKLFSGQARG